MIPISQTQSNWMKLQISIGQLKIHGTFIQPLIAVEQILGLWAYQATSELCAIDDLRDPDQFHFQQLVLGQSGQPTPERTDDDQVTILFYHANQAWIVRAAKSQEELSNLFPEYPSGQPFFTSVNALENTKTPTADMVLYAELPTGIAVTTDPCILVDMIPHIKIYVHTQKPYDIVFIMLDLQDHRGKYQLQMWTFAQDVIPHEWMNRHGRLVHLSIFQGAVQIQIRPNQVTIPLPIPDVLEVTLFHMLRSFWTSISKVTGDPSLIVRMKWEGQLFWQGKLPAKLVITWIRQVTLIFLQEILGDEGLSIVAYGRRAGDFCSLEDLQTRCVRNEPSSIMLAFVPTLSGGGPVKQTWDVEIRNQIACTLLPMGIPIDNLPHIADTVLKATGRAKLQHILKNRNSEQQKQQIVEAVENAGFSVQKFQKLHPKPQPLLKKPKADQIRQELIDMELEGVQIEPGFFLAEDDSQINQIDQLYPKTTGIVLTKEAQIRDWLIAGNPISPDPLGAFVVGVQELSTTLPQQAVLVPARSSKGLPLILSGSLVQFGESVVQYKPQTDQTSFTCKHDTQVVSVTVWQDEMNPEEWTELIRKPNQFIQNAFAEHNPSPIFLSMWGTSHQAKGKPIEKSKAESIQIHATIAKEKLPDVLRKSGIHGMYIIPKSPEGTPDKEWKIIWLPTPLKVPGAKEEVVRMMSKIQQPYGLVRNKTAYGIRVREDHFEEAWQVAHPSQPIPTTIADKRIFKVMPLPFGCPPEAIKQWLQHIQWNAVIVRPIGPKAWIIAASDDPPSQFVTFNGTPTLIRKLPSRDARPQPVVVAGQKLQPMQSSSKDTMLHTDPWAKYTPTTNIPMGPTTSKVSEPAVGLVQTQIQRQDDKIQTLADEVIQLRKMQETAQKETANKINQVEKAVDQTKEIFSSQMTQLKQELENSFQQAITVQNNSINQGFNELKNMFMQTSRSAGTRRTWDEATSQEDASMWLVGHIYFLIRRTQCSLSTDNSLDRSRLQQVFGRGQAGLALFGCCLQHISDNGHSHHHTQIRRYTQGNNHSTFWSICVLPVGWFTFVLFALFISAKHHHCDICKFLKSSRKCCHNSHHSSSETHQFQYTRCENQIGHGKNRWEKTSLKTLSWHSILPSQQG